MSEAAPPTYVLRLSCPDARGIVYAVARAVAEAGCSIVESEQYGDHDTATFFLRMAVEPVEGGAGLAELQAAFAPVAAEWQMSWQLVEAGQPARVLVMVSQFGHCLNDLLFRAGSGNLPVEIAAVVSNHTDFASLAAHYDVPFHHVPVTRATRDEADDRLLRLVEQERVDLVVLARYMQILSPRVCAALPARIINIHHSLLPSFSGARAYHQARQRGVKVVGATAHYVTPELDEGPIIEQELARVDHTFSAEQLAAAGRDVECLALARAVRWHAENRVLVNGGRTVVFGS